MSELRQKLTFDASQALKTLTKVSQNLDKASASLTKFGNAAQKANTQKISGKFNSLSRAVSNVKAKTKGGLGLKEASAEIQNAQAGLTKLSNGLKKSEQRATAASRAFKSLGSVAKFASGILIGQLAFRAVSSLIAGFEEAIASAIELSKAIGEIQTIAGGGIGSSEKVADDIRQISTALGTSTANIAEGYYQTLSNQVVEAGEAFEFLAETQKLATATVSSTSAAVQAASSIMNSYGERAGSVSDISDKLFKSVELGRLRLEEIGNIMGRVTPLASKLGVSIDELLASIVTMTRQGVKANTAITQMRAILLKLIKPGEDLQSLFTEWGVEDAEEAIRVYGGFEGVLRKIMEHTDGASSRTGELFDRVRALAGVLALNVENGDRYTETLREIEAASGAVDKAIGTLDRSIGRKYQKNVQELKNRWQELAESVIPFLNKTVRTLNVLFGAGSDKVDDYRKELKDLNDSLQRDDIADDYRKSLEQLDSEFEKSSKALANYTLEWNKLPDEIEAATNRMSSIVDVLGTDITESAGVLSEGLSKALSGGFKGLEKNAEEDLQSIDEMLKDHKEKLEVALAPEDKKLTTRYRQLVNNLNSTLSQLGEEAYGTKAFDELSSEAQSIYNEMLSLGRQARTEGEGIVLPSIENYANQIKEAINTKKDAYLQFQEALKSDAETRDVAKSALEKITDISTLRKDIADLVTKQESLIGEDAEKAEERLGNLRDRLEEIELTPTEKEIILNLPLEDIDEFLKQLEQGVKDFTARVPVEFTNVQEALQRELEGKAAKVEAELSESETAIVDELQNITSAFTPTALKDANSELEKEAKNQLNVQKEIRDATKDVKTAIEQQKLVEKLQPEKTAPSEIFSDSYADQYKALQAERSLIEMDDDPRTKARQKALDQHSEEITREIRTADKISDAYDALSTKIQSYAAYLEAYGKALPSDKVKELADEINQFPSEVLNDPAAKFLAEGLKNIEQVNSGLLETKKLTESLEGTEVSVNAPTYEEAQGIQRRREETRPSVGGLPSEEDIKLWDRVMNSSASATEEMNQNISSVSLPTPQAQFLATALLGASTNAKKLETELEETSNVDAKKPVEEFTRAVQNAPTLEGSLGNLSNFDTTSLDGLTTTLNTIDTTTSNISKNFTELKNIITPVGEASINIAEMATSLKGLPSTLTATTDAFTQLAPAFDVLKNKLENAFGSNMSKIIGNIKSIQTPLAQIPGLISQSVAASSALNQQAGTVTTSINRWPLTVQKIIPPIQAAITAMQRLKAAADAALQAASAATSSTSSARYGKYFASGGRGMDTIDAKLSKGEFVVNAQSARKFYSELVALNSGKQPVHREQGGPVTNVGDINVSVQGQETPRQTIREIAQGLRRELKRGTIKL